MHAGSTPRMSIAAPLLRGSGELHIVGRDDVVTIEDPDGAVHRLVELADGSRSALELATALAADHPHLTHDDVLDALGRLEAAGLVVDGRPHPRDRRPLALLR